MKSPAQLEHSEEKQFQWEILFERKLVFKPEIDTFSLPVWAGTWKIMNFAFRQQKQDWDRIWPDYQLTLSNKFDEIQQLEEQVRINIITIIVFMLFFALSTLLAI